MRIAEKQHHGLALEITERARFAAGVGQRKIAAELCIARDVEICERRLTVTSCEQRGGQNESQPDSDPSN
jgi:hypothetical protein